MNKATERALAFTFGVVFVVVLLVLAIAIPNPTPFQYTIFRIVLALAAAGVVVMVDGFLEIEFPGVLRAGGALGVFVIVYFYSPAELVGVQVKTPEQIEIDRPIVGSPQEKHSRWSALALGILGMSSAFADVTVVPELEITTADELSKPGLLAKRYKKISVVGVRAVVPPNATLVANIIEGRNGGALVGTEFSIVAQYVRNIAVDLGGKHPGRDGGGTLRAYVKRFENARILAKGPDGLLGQQGAVGANGAPGANGRDGDCGGFGRYRGADPGGPGGDAGNGSDGQPGGDGMPGGLVSITTIEIPVANLVDVSGGEGGQGGEGGPPGSPGPGGRGGAGCTGLGGTQLTQNNGPTGRTASPGHRGSQGDRGRPGIYTVTRVPNFDPLLVKLNGHGNDELHRLLPTP